MEGDFFVGGSNFEKKIHNQTTVLVYSNFVLAYSELALGVYTPLGVQFPCLYIVTYASSLTSQR